MADLSDLITCLVVTSPTASDPSTETIDTTIASVAAHEEIERCGLRVGADGVRPEQRQLSLDYYAKLHAIGETYGHLVVEELGSWGHQANVMRMLLENVETPLLLFCEHDTPLLPAATCPIDWQGCAETLIAGELDLIRFHHESRVIPEHEHLMLGGDDEDGATRRIPYLRTVQWSQRPHLARTDWYRNLIDTYFGPSSRCFIEDCLHGVVSYAWREHGLEGWNRYKLALYADMEPTMQRSYHLDGRAGDPKGGQVFAYAGDAWPEGAPAPTLGRVFE